MQWKVILYDNWWQPAQWLDQEDAPKHFPKPNLHLKRSWCCKNTKMSTSCWTTINSHNQIKSHSHRTCPPADTEQGPAHQNKTRFFLLAVPSRSLNKPLSLLHQTADRRSKKKDNPTVVKTKTILQKTNPMKKQKVLCLRWRHKIKEKQLMKRDRQLSRKRIQNNDSEDDPRSQENNGEDARNVYQRPIRMEEQTDE